MGNNMGLARLVKMTPGADGNRTRRWRWMWASMLPASLCVLSALPLAAQAEGGVPVRSISYEGTLPPDASEVFDAVAASKRTGTLDKTEALDLAQRMTTELRGAGYPVATVILTQQDWDHFANSGELKLHAFEGDVGRVVVAKNTSEVNSARIQKTAELALCGSRGVPCALTSAGLERAALLVQDLPGVKIAPVVLNPEGVDIGQTSVELTAEPSHSRFRGGASVDNYGVAASGANRVGVNAQADNLLHMGDVWQLGAMTTNAHQNTGSFGFSLPLGYDGWRADANVARTTYSLPQVDASGVADSVSAGVSYPLARGLDRNWVASLQGFAVRTQQTVTGVDLEPNHLRGMRLGVTGNSGDRPMDLGLSFWSANASLTFGRKSQDVVGIDTTGMVGNYTKVSLSLLDKQVLNKDWYALFNMRAQLGSRNLDAYEAMSVGGVTGVRAFSASEGSLNNALFLSTELRRLVRLPDGSQIAPGVFIDYITGRVVHSPYAGWQTSLGYADPNLSNHRWLAAWGLGVDWVSPKGMFNASMTIAWKLPGSPDSVVSPGSARARVLLSAGLKF